MQQKEIQEALSKAVRMMVVIRRSQVLNLSNSQLPHKNYTESQKQAEDKFLQMLDYLSKPKYFETVWEDIESLCIQVEELLERREKRYSNKSI